MPATIDAKPTSSSASSPAIGTSELTADEMRQQTSAVFARMSQMKIDPSMVRSPREWEVHQPDAATAAWFKKSGEVMKLLASSDGSMESRIAVLKAESSLEPMPSAAWQR